MAISATDRYYLAETTPASISRLGAGLRAAYGRPATAFGAKGNLAHARGYHRSRAWILGSPDSARGSGDYSVQHALDKGGAASDVSAFDFTPGDWGSAENRRRMIELTSRVYAAAKARDPRLSALREFAGTLDGKTVITFNCADGSLRSPFDSSHVDHIHGSFWRSRCANDHAGLLAVLLGDDMTNPVEETDVSYNDLIYTVSDISTMSDVISGGPDKGKPNSLAVVVKAIDSQAKSNGGGISEIKTMLGQIGQVTPTDEQWVTLTTSITQTVAQTVTEVTERLFAEKVGKAAEIAAEAAIRRVLGSLDGAVPPQQ